MARFYITCLCLVALSTTICAAKSDEEATKRGENYVDDMLANLCKDEEYDPYQIDDSAVGFSKKVIFVDVTGEAKLYDGYIKGLCTLHRSGRCSLHEEGERLRIKCDFGAGELYFHYSGTVKFMNFGPTITVKGNLTYVEVHVEFTVDSKTGKNGRLEKFIIDDMRGMTVRVTGLGPLNWAINPIISGITKIFKNFVRHFLEKKVKIYIMLHIKNYQFPVAEGKETEAPAIDEPETTSTQTSPPTEPDTKPEKTSPPTEPETKLEKTSPPTEPEPKETSSPTEPETKAEETTPAEVETEPTESEETTETEPNELEESNPLRLHEILEEFASLERGVEIESSGEEDSESAANDSELSVRSENDQHLLDEDGSFIE